MITPRIDATEAEKRAKGSIHQGVEAAGAARRAGLDEEAAKRHSKKEAAKGDEQVEEDLVRRTSQSTCRGKSCCTAQHSRTKTKALFDSGTRARGRRHRNTVDEDQVVDCVE
jgi:hypothetical protein